MGPFSFVTLFIFIAGYTTARWHLGTRLYELAIFAWDNGVVARTARGFLGLSLLFAAIAVPVVLLARTEGSLHPRASGVGVSAREQLRRRGSF
jgi:phosphatidylinositol glycan class Q protein